MQNIQKHSLPTFSISLPFKRKYNKVQSKRNRIEFQAKMIETQAFPWYLH